MELLTIGILFAVFIILSIIFRRWFSALILDYGVDGGLSLLDNFIFGAGLIGIDFGDWLAAIIIFFKERKVTSGWVGFVVAWEAANFLPFGMIPVIGDGIELVFNFFPAVMISRILFSKYRPAKKAISKLKNRVFIAGRINLPIDSQRQDLVEAEKLMKANDFVDALRSAQKTTQELNETLRKAVAVLSLEAQDQVQQIESQDFDAPEESIDILRQGIAATEQLMAQANQAAQAEEFEIAIQSALQAKDTINAAVRDFESTLR